MWDVKSHPTLNKESFEIDLLWMYRGFKAEQDATL